MPHGTRPTSLWPRGARPRSRVMLVLVQVSSRKTRRRGSPHRQDVRFRETTSSDRATWMGAKRTPVLHKSSRLCENSIVEPPHVRIFLCCQTGRAERSTPAAPRGHLLLVAVTVQSFHTVCKNFAPRHFALYNKNTPRFYPSTKDWHLDAYSERFGGVTNQAKHEAKGLGIPGT